MNQDVHLLFWLYTAKMDETGKAPVYMRVTCAGERAQLSLGLKIEAQNWKADPGRARGKSDKARLINQKIDKLRAKVDKICYELEMKGHNFIAKEIVAKVKGNAPDRDGLLSYFDDFNQKNAALVGVEIVPKTQRFYVLTKNYLAGFISQKFKIQDIRLVNIKQSFIADFETFLKTRKALSNNTTMKYLRAFKRIITLAHRNGLIEKDPFVDYRLRFTKVSRECLDESELMELVHHDFESPRLSYVRDMFVFSCYTGIAYVDVMALKPENLTTDKSGKRWIKGKRGKTGVSFMIPLLPQASDILKRYEDDNFVYPKKKGHLLPYMTNQHLNHILKKVAKACGISKSLTFHMARHTFATTVTLSNGVSIESVSKMLGHSDIKTTQIYSKVMEDKISREMERLM